MDKETKSPNEAIHFAAESLLKTYNSSIYKYGDAWTKLSKNTICKTLIYKANQLSEWHSKKQDSEKGENIIIDMCNYVMFYYAKREFPHTGFKESIDAGCNVVILRSEPTGHIWTEWTTDNFVEWILNTCTRIRYLLKEYSAGTEFIDENMSDIFGYGLLALAKKALKESKEPII